MKVAVTNSTSDHLRFNEMISLKSQVSLKIEIKISFLTGKRVFNFIDLITQFKIILTF